MSFNSQKRNFGFTLIESLMVMAILGMITALALGSFREIRNRSALSDAQSMIILALEDARSRASTGVGTTSHGVRIEAKKITSFEGADFDHLINKFEIPLPPSISTDQMGADIIFSRLSAKANLATTVTISSSAVTGNLKITVKEDGSINPQ